MFIANEPPPRSYVTKVNWDRNPFFPVELEEERVYLRDKDLGLYNHVWEGQLLENSDAQIFKDSWIVENFDIDMSQIFYVGLDFGYSVDPAAAIACYIKEKKLYIAYEAGRTKLDIDELGAYCEKRIPMFKTSRIYADSASPGNIAYMVKRGYNIHPALKKQGSVEDGIAFIRSFDYVVIHPSCKETIQEFTLYSYKVDPHSEEVTTKIVDAYNHYIDAIRYALNKLIYKKQTKWEAYRKYA
jgi:phage terminase large subunit